MNYLKKIENEKKNKKRSKSGVAGLGKPNPRPDPIKQRPVRGPARSAQA